MKTLAPPAKRSRKNVAPRRQASRWIPGGLPTKPPTRKQVAEFNRVMDEIAALVHDLPPDLAINHDYYLHGLPKRKP